MTKAGGCPWLPGSSRAPKPGGARGRGAAGPAWCGVTVRGGRAAGGGAGPGRAAPRSDPSGRNEPGKLSNSLTRVADAHTWVFKSDSGKGRRGVEEVSLSSASTAQQGNGAPGTGEECCCPLHQVSLTSWENTFVA